MRNYFQDHPAIWAIVFALIMFGIDVIGVLIGFENVSVLLSSGVRAVLAAIIFYVLIRWTGTKSEN